MVLRRHLPAVITTVITTVVATLALLWPATSAEAHDALKSSSPKKNAKVTTIDRVVLEFTASVQHPTVVVRNESGDTFQTGDPRTDRMKVTQRLTTPLPSGKYTIAFRVVSSDGHPITGEIPFTVVAAPAPTASPTPSSTPSNLAEPTAASSPAAPPVTAQSSAQAEAQSGEQEASTSGNMSGVFLLATGAVILIAGAAFLLAGRKKGRT
jgi:methionine-rich copper-binding protein CopC